MKKSPKLMLVFALMFLSNGLRAADSDEAVTWKSFQYLIGDWVGVGSGKPGEGTGEFSLRYDLDKKILIRRNLNHLAPKPGEKATLDHEDLMVIYPQGNNFRADYFDNEGHVIHYSVSCTEKKTVFESDATENRPKFRLTYEMKTPDVLTIDFAVAAPGKDFQTYISGTAKRK
jgi:hypothetical protein